MAFGLGLLAAAVVMLGTVGPPVPSADQIAAARAEGDAILRAGHAETLFLNETGDPGLPPTTLIRLRHRASGFLCTFDPGKAANRVDVFRSLTPGYDVGCTTQTITDVRTLYLFHVPDRSNEDLLKTAEYEVHAADPTLALYTSPTPDRPLPAPLGMSLPDHLTAGEASDRKGVRIVIGKVGDWAVQYRFYGPRMIAGASDLLDPFWRTVVLERQRHAATADNAKPSVPPPTPALQDLKAEGDTLIARGQGMGLFENLTSSKVVLVRHTPSGFTCVFDPGHAENAIQVFANPVRGNDVGCTTREADAIVSYYVTKLPAPLPLEQVLQGEVQAIRIAHPDASPATRPRIQITLNRNLGAPPPVPVATARFTYNDHGEIAYSRVSVALIHGWIIEQRVTAPADKGTEADLVADVGMMSATDKMANDRIT